MATSRLLFLLLSVMVENPFVLSGSAKFEYSADLSPDDLYSFKWSVSLRHQYLRVQSCLNLTRLHRAQHLNLFGLAFGAHDQAVELDAYLLSQDADTGQNLKFIDFHRAYVDKSGLVRFRTEDNSFGSLGLHVTQMVRDVRVKSSNKSICLEFKRPFKSDVRFGYDIDNQTTRVFLFHGSDDNMFIDPNEPILKYPVAYDEEVYLAFERFDYELLRVQLIKSILNEPIRFGKDVRIFDLRVQNVQIPAEETTYWCKTEKLPPLKQKHHIIRYEGIVTPTSQGKVHHMEVFQCVGKSPVPDYDAPCNSETKPMGLRQCRNVIGAWAMGAKGLSFPKETGLPIGNQANSDMVVIEIHYTNPDKISGLIDSSGIRFYVTDQLRPNDAGLMELGLVYSPNNAIPPGQNKFSLTGYCDEQCTSIALPDQGITAFASQLHTHGTGIKVVTYHLRYGQRLPDLNRDNHYSPHFQEIRLLSQPVQIMPGDTLVTKCTYTTLDKDHMTVGGIGQENEMCLNYLFYYPKINLELCKSELALSALELFFESVQNFKSWNSDNVPNSIEEQFNSVQWTADNVRKLAYFYENMPIEMHCNSSRGERLKESDSFRKPTPIPPN